MTLEESIKRICEMIETDDELRRLAILTNKDPEKNEELLQDWTNGIVDDTIAHAYIPALCKQDPADLCRQVDDLYQETFGDLDQLFKTVPCLRRFAKDML